jgi:DNA modification methylase
MKEYFKNKLTTIYNGDCLEVMKQYDDNHFDLCLTDPPYGIGASKGVGGFGASGDKAKKYNDAWDDFTPTEEYFKEILRVSKNVIIFGGNYFADKLPVNGHWIVWDKVSDIKFDNPFSDCELAYTNFSKKTVKKYTQLQQGFLTHEKDRYHPTQKPIELFVDLLKDYNKDKGLVLDCFGGSGTTSIACEKLGLENVIIEKETKYCEIIKDRLSKLQMRLDI